VNDPFRGNFIDQDLHARIIASTKDPPEDLHDLRIVRPNDCRSSVQNRFEEIINVRPLVTPSIKQCPYTKEPRLQRHLY